jgi:hypothetical protein
MNWEPEIKWDLNKSGQETKIRGLKLFAYMPDNVAGFRNNYFGKGQFNGIW